MGPFFIDKVFKVKKRLLVMTINNPILRDKVGMSFEFKRSFIQYLYKVLSASEVYDYDVEGNSPEIREEAVNKVDLTTPAMKFEYKAAAYRSLALIDEAILNSEGVGNTEKSKISSLTMLVSRYVGLSGDDDYHFMVAVYQLSEAISEALEIDDTPGLLLMAPPAPEPPPAPPAPEPPSDPVV